MYQLAEYSWSHFCYSPLITRGSVGSVHWSHFCYSPPPVDQLAEYMVIHLLLSTHNQWISWQSTFGHTSVTFHSWISCYSPLITSYSPLISTAVRVHLVTLHFSPLITRGLWQGTAGHTSVSLHSYSHTSVTLHSSPVDQLAEHSWSHFCYSPLITRGSAGRVQLVTLLLLSIHHTWINWQSTAVTLLLLSTHNPWISWQGTAGHTSVTLHSSPVDQLAGQPDYSWFFCYSPLIS